MKSARTMLLVGGIVAALSYAGAQDMEFWKFGSAEDPANELLLEWVDEWNAENSDAQVEMRFIPFGEYAAGGAALPTAFAAGSGPDIFWTSAGTFMQYARSGLLADLSSIFTDELREDLLPAAIEASSYDGVPVAMPFEQEPVALFYNEDLLDEAGVEVPTTWEDLLDAAERLDESGTTPIVIEPNPGGYQNFTWYPFLWAAGGEVADAELTEATFDSEGTAQALDLWRTLIQEGYAPRTSSEQTNAVGSTPFASGEAAMLVVGMWAIQELENDFPDVNFGVAQLPHPEGMEPVSVYGGWSQVVSAQSDNVEKAIEFTEWMWAEDPERPLEWVSEANTKFSPRRSVTEAGSDFYDQEHLRDFRDEILPDARAEPRFSADIVRIVNDALQAAMFRNVSGDEAAAQAQRELERAIADLE